MRPVHMVLQAFGPYAGREEVDFREAVESGLFGVYGPTGAGKSTLFSAMTFALFGEAAKAEQESASLRSDHADPALPTEVEFLFDIGDRRFLIVRRPEQARAKQRGGGTTTDAHEAFLFDATGLAPETITPANRGKVIAEKKVGAVRDAVIALLGYGPDQFRQIVLLPQGKFETFLAAKTDKRLEILRDLFDVSVYRGMAASFREQAAAAEKHIRQEREVCSRRLVTEGFESPDALAEGLSVARATQQAETAAEAAATANREQAQAALATAQQRDSQFRAAAAARAALDGLLAKGPEIESVAARLKTARLAQSLADVDQNRVSAAEEVARAQAHVETTARLSGDAATKAAHAAQAHEQQRASAPQAEALRNAAESLAAHLRTLDDAATHAASAGEAETALRAAQSAHAATETALAGLVAQRRTADQSLRQSRTQDAEQARLEAERIALAARLSAAEQYETAAHAVATARTGLDRAIADHARLKDDARAAQARFESAEAALATAQSLHLAARLSPGAPCPVCGSPDHPAPATGQPVHAGLDRQFRETKQACDQAQDELQKAAQALAAAESLWQERAARLAELATPERPAAQLRAPLQDLLDRIEALGPRADLPQAEALLARLDEQITRSETAREAARAALNAANERATVARDRLDRALATVPEPLREKTALEAAIAANKAERARLQAALEAAEATARTAREAALGAAKDAEAAVLAHSRASAQLGRAEAIFVSRLAETGLSGPEFRAALPLVAAIPADAETVANHATALAVARSAEESLRNALAGQSPPDLPPLEQAAATAAAELEEASARRHAAAARADHLARLQEEIAAALREQERLEQETAPLRSLAALFNADNPQRLDLETFAIGAMFDQVLAAANQRLGPMTAGRYTLERDGEGGGRARRGLGIRVLDIHTGKARAPATLSGGETFIAALALALGLSDIVESSGRVRLDTIFIDEGFGSLDTENDAGTLDQVLQVLTTLVSQSRTVGLISHVPLVQEAVPDGFYIRKDARGSHVETRRLR